MTPDDEETANVFEIIADLERQLDIAFGVRDAQDNEIAVLKEQLTKTEQRVTALKKEARELKAAVAAQEELNSALEFLEGERLEASKRIGSLEEQLNQKAGVVTGLEGQVESLAADVRARNVRVEQTELELTSSSRAIRNLQGQITLLEQEKEILTGELERAVVDMNNVTAERDKSRKELDRARRGLAEIRGTLSKTRAKAKKRYYRAIRKKNTQDVEDKLEPEPGEQL